MRRILSAALIAAVAGASMAQQDPQFTQFMFDRLSINPGSAGITGNMCATLLLRQQWTGFDGAPKTGLFNFQTPISKISSGVGLSVYFDDLGQEKTTIGRLSYSYHKTVGVAKLGIGLYAGLTSRSLGSKWIAVDDVSLDDAIPDNGASASGFDAGLGLFYEHPKFYIGLSSTQLPETKLDAVSIQNARHYYVQAGYRYKINDQETHQLLPNLLIKSDAASTQFDINLTYMYNKMVWLGVSYRMEDAVAPMIGYQYEAASGKSAFKIGYSYDVTTSELKNYSSGSHEVMLNYCFKIVPPVKIEIYRNPRIPPPM